MQTVIRLTFSISGTIHNVNIIEPDWAIKHQRNGECIANAALGSSSLRLALPLLMRSQPQATTEGSLHGLVERYHTQLYWACHCIIPVSLPSGGIPAEANACGDKIAGGYAHLPASETDRGAYKLLSSGERRKRGIAAVAAQRKEVEGRGAAYQEAEEQKVPIVEHPPQQWQVQPL